MSLAPIVHGGGVTEAARHFGGEPADWLDLSTGINPNPVAVPDIPVRAWHRLPDRHLFDAASAAARSYYKSGETQPLPVPGTQSVIQLLPRLLPPGRRAAILGPTYGEYGRVLRATGHPVDDITDLSMISDEHALVVVVNPNNPTGRVVDASTLEALAVRLEAQAGFLLVDEAFGDAEPAVSLAGRVGNHPRLIVFRSFGKFFGLAGLRLGFVIATGPVLAAFREWLGPWAVSGPALVIAAALMQQERTSIEAMIAQRKNGLDTVLTRAGLSVVGGTRLFSLVEHPNAAALHAALCSHRILTRRFDYAPDWLRIGLAPDDMADTRLAAALADVLPKLGGPAA